MRVTTGDRAAVGGVANNDADLHMDCSSWALAEVVRKMRANAKKARSQASEENMVEEKEKGKRGGNVYVWLGVRQII